MPNLSPRFSVVQQTPRMNSVPSVVLNPMTRLREPQKFNQTPINNNITYSQSPPLSSTTTIDISPDYSSRQVNGTNQTDYSSLQPQFSIQTTMNVPRQRMSIPNINFQQQQQQQQQQQPTSSNKPSDILHQILVGHSSSMPMSSLASSSSLTTTSTTINTNNSSTGDQSLQRILVSNTNGGSNKILMQNRQTTPTIMSQPPRSLSTTNSNLNNSTNTIRPSLPAQQSLPSPSFIVIPASTPTSTVQIQPSNHVTIQQSPLNNNNGPLSINSQILSASSSTPMNINYSSPTNRTLPLTGSGSISSPDDETANLIKYLNENVNRLQLLSQKFTNEGNTEKIRQVQSAHQQILQFISNPTYESLPNARRFRDVLEQIPNRLQQANSLSTSSTVTNSTTTTTTTTTTHSQPNVFNQCIKATKEFLSREQKDRVNILKRYLEPLSDVINGVPHKMIRLDVDNPSTIKIRSSNQSSLLSNLNDEINQLPDDIYSIEYISVSCTRKRIDNDNDNEYLSKNGIILQCKLLEKSNPLIPSLRLHITTSYPEQPPEILSLTKTMPPKLEYADGHPFFDQISSIFVSHLFKLNVQHTITDILNIWRQSVQAAL
ncbi:unnamed protein product [Rotaria sp. Silwood1]|nr:unnamed protein product [Rotaria sp. Silwood1]